jgi:hypothetical protein
LGATGFQAQVQVAMTIVALAVLEEGMEDPTVPFYFARQRYSTLVLLANLHRRL